MLGTAFLHCNVDGETLANLLCGFKVPCGFVSQAVLSHIAGCRGAQLLSVQPQAQQGSARCLPSNGQQPPSPAGAPPVASSSAVALAEVLPLQFGNEGCGANVF